MKRFSKLLLMIFVLVTALTVLTTVTFATENTTTETAELTPVVKNEYTFDDMTVGTSRENTAAGVGRFRVNSQEGTTDHYLENANYSGSGTSYIKGMYYFGWKYNDSTELHTPLSDYPYAVFEIDTMKPNTYYSNFSITMYVKNKDSKQAGNVQIKGDNINLIRNALPSESYQWAKLTLIFKYHSVANEDGTTTGYVDVYGYVNGDKVLEMIKATSIAFNANGINEATTQKVSGLYFTDLRFNGASTGGESRITAIDNLKLTAYPASYSLDEIVAETYYEGYKFPYTKTYALVDGKGYESLDAAFNAATDGQTVSPRVDITDNYVINKAIKVDTNKYTKDAETGELVPTGEYYAFNYASTEGYTAEYAGGVYTFSKSASLVTVTWDPACDGDCDCYVEYGGHRLTDTKIVPLGEIPEYLGELPTFEMGANYSQKIFLGWSYENDGTVDDITEITAEQVALGAINLYPVYVTRNYAVEIVNKSGVASYYFEEDFDKAVAAAASGSTVTLLDDVTMYHTIMIKKSDYVLTLDLNGYTLTRHYATLTTYDAVYDEASGTYVKNGSSTGTVVEGADTNYIVQYGSGGVSYANCVFGINASRVNITLTSSRSGAEIYAYATTADALIYNGKTVKMENVSVNNGLMLFYLTPATGTITANTANITTYCGSVFAAEHGGNGSEKITVNGGTFYTIGSPSEGVLGIRNGEKVTINNATFFANGGNIIKNQGTNRDKNTEITFNNCKIYDAEINCCWKNDIYTFNNCELAIVPNNAAATVILGEGTLINSTSKVNVVKGTVLAPQSAATYSYAPIASVSLEYDPASGEFVRTIVYSEPVTGTFGYSVQDAYDVEGIIDGAMLSVIYQSNFKLAFYLPVDEAFTYDSVAFTKADTTVFIDGKEYYVYTQSLTTAGASDEKMLTVAFTKGEDKYVQTFYISALTYAEIVLSSPENDLEAKAVANMVRFIKEARTLSGLEISDKFAELEALYAPTEYKDKAEYADLGVDYSGLVGTGISFAVKGANVSYVIELPVSNFANAADATVTLTFQDGTAATLTKTATETGCIWHTTNTMHITKLLDQYVTITITVPGAEGDTVLSGTYSIGAYIQAMDNSFAKAMYEFGNAAKAHREYLETL